MKLHDLTTTKKKKAQRVGRGGKRGTTSGKGQKGQKSRSGHRMRPAIRDLISRIPKRRGYRNKPKGAKALSVDVAQLAMKMRPLKGGAVDLMVLKKVGLVPSHYYGAVKVLGKESEIGVALMLKGIKASAAAKAAIEKAGGSIK